MKYKVKAIFNFNDLTEKVPRKAGDIFEVDEERKNFLLDHKAIEVVEEPKQEEELPTKQTGEEITEVEEQPKKKKRK